MTWKFRVSSGWIGTENATFGPILFAIIDASSTLLPLPTMLRHALQKWVVQHGNDRCVGELRSASANEIKRRNLNEPGAGLFMRSRAGVFKTHSAKLLVDPNFRLLREECDHRASTILHEYLHFYDEEVLGKGIVSVSYDGRFGLPFRQALADTDEYKKMMHIASHTDQMMRAWAKDLRTLEPEVGAEDYFKGFKKAREYTKYLMRADEMFVRTCTELLLSHGNWANHPTVKSEIRESLNFESRVTLDRVKILLKVKDLSIPQLIPATNTIVETSEPLKRMVARSLG